jgi:hypothetical protein
MALRKSKAKPESWKGPAHRVRLPGFLIEEEIGLGDLIKKTTRTSPGLSRKPQIRF